VPPVQLNANLTSTPPPNLDLYKILVTQSTTMESQNQIINTEISKLQQQLQTLEDRKIPETTYFNTATRLHDTYRHMVWISLVLFGIGLGSLSAYLYLHYGREDAFYQDVKSIVISIFIAGLFIYIGICAGLPLYFRMVLLPRIKRIEEEMKEFKNKES
jgi:hypothetical protein